MQVAASVCGIAGELTFDSNPASIEAVGAMLGVLARRGPDAAGLEAHGRVVLGHRRLKIIDLTERGRQPMHDPALGMSIVFNGLIYNYEALRSELQQAGHHFFSKSDTEVVLRAYAQWGDACVERFNGMFAFAIHERESGAVFLARDRLGIKPLYLHERGARLRFASSLPALLAAGDVAPELDAAALHHYLTLHGVVPAPRTILADVRKLPPATTMRIDATGQRRARVYWHLDYRPEEGPSFEDWQEELALALRRSVRRRLVADVPVGVLLSGGLDSSLIVALLRREGQGDLATFSIGFESARGEEGDEFRFSDLVAREFETDHHRIFVSPDETMQQLEACIGAMSEPMVSHDNIGFYLLGREVSRTIKVVQSGQGADEVFAGYHWYPPLLQSRDPVADYARVFFDRGHAEMRQVLQPRWVDRDYTGEFLRAAFDAPGAARPIDRALRLDTTVMLVDDPVKRVDNHTMAWGLEARVPFLDHELVELAARIPAEHKARDGGKGVLKALARRFLPAEVIDRPKGYFPVPALKYLDGPLLEEVRELLTGPRARARALYQPDYIGRLLEDPAAHITPLRGSKLWQLALLERWLQHHGL